jgi:hypothetical protein
MVGKMKPFPLTPHIKAILCGRGMCKDGRLLCAATNCLFHPKESTDPDFGRDIEIKGYAVCPRCNTKTDYSDGAEWDDRHRRVFIRCKTCKKIISRKKIVWTQEVYSKHRKSNHQYYHIECWDAMFIDIPDDDESAHYHGYHDEEHFIVRLIKWALLA